ncbi:MAG: hypothetical protein WD988_00400 [Candidatus Curtissbacteria bacterium]
MATNSGFFKGDKKKKKKEVLERQAGEINRVYSVPQVEIIGKKKKDR